MTSFHIAPRIPSFLLTLLLSLGMASGLFMPLGNSSRAATIEVLGKKETGMGVILEISLSGPITSGDAKKLISMIRNSDGSWMSDDYPTFLYLNSPGGSYLEGIEIAKIVNSRLVRTRILAGSECYSSCAIAFLGGAREGDEDGAFGATFIDRVVNIGGRLGFHAPYLDVPEGTYSKQSVDEAYHIAVLSIAELIRLSKTVGILPVIIPEILDVSSDDIRTLETVDDFARFNIGLGPIPTIQTLTKSMIENACRNGYAWGFSKVMGEGSKELISPAELLGGGLTSITIETTYFSNESRPGVRSILPVARWAEGTIAWCIFDHITIDGGVQTSCRGFIGAYDLEEATARATQLDQGNQYGQIDSECILVAGGDDVYAFVPGETRVEEAEPLLHSYASTEKAITQGH